MHKVGDTIWRFDRNHRVYRQGASGHSGGSPIFRERFRFSVIAGETSKSWILYASGLKVPKSGGDVRECGGGPFGKTRVYMTQAAVDDAVFRDAHQYNIARAVEYCRDVAVLRQVAALIGYTAEE